MSDHPDIEAGRKFNDAVGATGVVGSIRSDLANLQGDVTEVKIDVKALGQNVKAIRSQMDQWTGSLKVWAGVPGGIAIALSVYSILFR